MKTLLSTLSTGAIDVAISLELARQLVWLKGMLLNTANGSTQGLLVPARASLQLSAIVLRDIRTVAALGLEGEQILLGISSLNKLEFTKRGSTMLLCQTTN